MENLFQSLTQAAPIIAIFGAAYFILFRPQQQKMKAHQDLLSRLAVGDSVITSGGLTGSVHKVEGDFVHVTIAPSVTVRVRKSHIVEILSHAHAGHEVPSLVKKTESSESTHTASTGTTPKRKAPSSEKKEASAKTTGRSAGKKPANKSNKKD
jgi:preprotein translocase subunit YajC